MKVAIKNLVVTTTLILSITSANAAESFLPDFVSFQADNGSFQVAVNIIKF